MDGNPYAQFLGDNEENDLTALPEDAEEDDARYVSRLADSLTAAQIWQESRGNPDAVSPKGARGLMQVIPSSGRDPGYGVTPLRDNSKEENVRFGEDYRNAMIDHFGGDETLGLMAYNWGPDNVQKWLDKGADPAKVPKETSEYVQNIQQRVGKPLTSAAEVEVNPYEKFVKDENPYAQFVQEQKQPGIIEALKHGGIDAIRSLLASKEAALKEKPKFKEEARPEAEALRLKDVLSGAVLPKLAYGVTRTSPAIAGAVAGGGAAGAVSGGNPLAAALGTGGGAALATMIQELGPLYAAEYEKTKDVDKALDGAMKRAATEGGISGAMFGAFGIAPFKGILKNLVLQAGAIQPAIGAGGQKIRNIQQGTEGGEGPAAESAALSTLIPALAHMGVRGIIPERVRPEPVPEPTPEAPVEPEMLRLAPPKNVVTPEGSIMTETQMQDLGITPDTIKAAKEAKARAPTIEEIDAAAAEAHPNPTEAQKEAGNYTKGHLSWNGLNLAIENPRGSERTGVNKGGEPWSVTMPDHYGYIKKTEGKDGDHVDIYMGQTPESPRTFIVDQVNTENGKFDEHKVMLGYPNKQAALNAYRSAFSDGMGDQRIGAVTAMNVKELKEWLKNEDTTKPVGKIVRNKIPEPAPIEVEAPIKEADVAPVKETKAPVLEQIKEVKTPEEFVPITEAHTTELADLSKQAETIHTDMRKARTPEQAAKIGRGLEDINKRINDINAEMAATQEGYVKFPEYFKEKETTGLAPKELKAAKVAKEEALSRVVEARSQIGETPTAPIEFTTKTATGKKTNFKVGDAEKLTRESFDKAFDNLEKNMKKLPAKAFFRSQEPSEAISAVERLAPGEDTVQYAQKLQDYVNEKMGKHAIKIDLVKALKDQTNRHVTGAFFPQHKMAYIAMHGSKGMSDLRNVFDTTRHETIHALKNAGLFKPDEWNALSRAAEARWMKKYDIEKNYGHLPKEVQIEEAVAEAFANRATLKEGPFLKNVMDKIGEFFNHVKDFITGERANVRSGEKVLEAVEKGELGKREALPEPSADVKFQRKKTIDEAKTFFSELKDAVSHMKTNAVPGTSFLKTMLYASDSNMRSVADAIKNPKGREALRSILDQWSARAGEARAVKETYEEAVQSHGNSVVNKLQKILGEDDENLTLLNQAVKMVQDPKTMDNSRAGKIAKDLTGLINDQLKYMKDAGIDIEGSPGYFPRMYDESKILKGPMTERRFVSDAIKAYELDPSIGPGDARAKAEAWLEMIKFGENSSIISPNNASAIPNFLKERTLGKEADTIMREWLEQDPRVVLAHYLTRSTKRAEFVRRLGEKMEKWHEQERQLRDGEADYAIPMLRDYIATVAGVRPKGFDYGTANITSWLRTWGTIGLLERSTLTSLPEFITPAIRSGNLLDIGKSLSGSIRDLIGKNKNTRELTEDLGLIVSHLSPTIQASRFGGGDPVSKLQQKVMTKYFQRVGLEQWTNATRVGSTGLGQTFIRRLATRIANGEDVAINANLLSELGIAAKDAAGFSKWLLKKNEGMPDVRDLQGGSEYEKAYRTAITRFVEQSILVPKISSRPKWANGPIGSVIFHLQAYNYAFQKSVLNRLLHMGKQDNLTAIERAKMILPTVAVLPMLTVAQYVLGDMRDEIFGTGQQKTEKDKLLLALNRSITGAADPLINMITSVRYDRDIATTLAGPALGQVLGAAEAGLKAVGDNSDKTNSAERRLAKAFYDVGVEPSVNFLLTALPIGPTAMAATQLVGAPKVREAFVGGVAGPKDERGDRTQFYSRLSDTLIGLRNASPEDRDDLNKQYGKILEDIRNFNKTAKQPITAKQLNQALSNRMKEQMKPKKSLFDAFKDSGSVASPQ